VIFSSFFSRNYRLYTIGQILSNIGFLIESIALSWLVYRLTHSGLYVGILIFTSQITIFFISPLSGILADRFERYKLLIYTNAITALMSLILGIAVISGVHSLWFIFSTQIIVGLTKGIDNPVRNTLVNDLIEKPEHLVNAISLNSSIFNIAKIIGPTIAAVLIPWKGEGICFILNSISYLSIITVLLLMKHKPKLKNNEKINVFKDIQKGFIYSFNYSPIRTVIIFVGLLGLLSFSLNVVLPVYAKEILKGGADTFGFITTYSGFGALIAALYMATKQHAFGLEVVIFIASLIYGAGFLLLSMVSDFALTSFIMIFVGFGQVLIFASASSILQTLADENNLGRVIGLYFMFFMACTTLGSLLAGKLTDTIGITLTIKIISVLTIVISLVYGTQIKNVRRKSFRRFLILGLDPLTFRNNPAIHINNKLKKFVYYFTNNANQ